MDREITIDPVIARRTALVAGLGGAGALALAACSSSGGSGTAAEPKDSSPTGATGATGATGPTSAATGTSRRPSGSTGGSKGIVALDSIQVGSSVGAKLNGNPVLVSRPSADSAACFSAICTHQGCIVEAAGNQFRCPCHGSVYNATTGAVIQGPAPSPLPKIPVQIRKGEIVPG
jgi:Rieske Fe-S protein